MQGTLRKAYGYQGNNLTLPVADVDQAIPFYTSILGFTVISHGDAPHRSALLGRDDVQIGIVESGGDSSQDGCAFHVDGLQALFEEFKRNGLQKEISDFDVEEQDGVPWKVFYVVAPDGLCYWFGERQPAISK
jgi:catechol 2,3-dioxygenase-like lactoylglutathione lyase family enzyme